MFAKSLKLGWWKQPSILFLGAIYALLLMFAEISLVLSWMLFLHNTKAYEGEIHSEWKALNAWEKSSFAQITCSPYEKRCANKSQARDPSALVRSIREMSGKRLMNAKASWKILHTYLWLFRYQTRHDIKSQSIHSIRFETQNSFVFLYLPEKHFRRSTFNAFVFC